ncbi:MAG: rhodanese-like domain-containing protein [Bacteroidia bacterium]|nr:rhodanese-like domain-containing protein [Bacteroidia bacterium]
MTKMYHLPKYLLLTFLVSALGFFPASGGNLYKNIKIAQADTLIRNHEGKADLVILDVRSPGEFSARHIRGAININFWDSGFTDSVSKLDRERTCLVYCTSGVRSSGATKKMSKLGFIKIYNMKRGMFGWRAAGLPVTDNKR